MSWRNLRGVRVSIEDVKFSFVLQNPQGMNCTGRDNQRQRVYTSESTALSLMHFKGADVSVPYLYIARVNQIMASEFVRINFPKTFAADQVKVEFSSHLLGANANTTRIKTSLRPYMMQEMFLLHELAHVLTRRELGNKVLWAEDGLGYESASQFPVGTNFNIHYIAGHGPEYAEIYLALVREFMGGMAALHLQRQFILRNVIFESPRMMHGRSGIKFTEHQDEEEVW